MGPSLKATRSPPRRELVDPRMLLVFATVLFGLSVRASSPAAGIAVALGTLLCAAVFRTWRDQSADYFVDRERHELRLLVSVVFFSILIGGWWAPSWIGPTTEALERVPGLAWAGLAVWLFSTRRQNRPTSAYRAITAITVGIVLVTGLIHVATTEGVGVDVYLLHQGAADAIADGQNPYGNAVQVPDGAPTASPGDTIVGYPYPPVAALTFSVGQWTLGDPRYAGLVCWLVVLGTLGISGARHGNRDRVWAMLLLAAIPGWPLVLRAGWTEPLTLVFLAASFLAWERAKASGTTMGLALASKQYFALTAPLAIFHRDTRWRTRILILGAVVLVAVVPALMVDVAAFWGAAVDFHTSRPLRTDSVNVVGALSYLGATLDPPRWLGPALGVVVALVLGRVSRTREMFFLVLVLSLATFFLFATQALANYWFLITGLCGLLLSTSHAGSMQAPSTRTDG